MSVWDTLKGTFCLSTNLIWPQEGKQREQQHLDTERKIKYSSTQVFPMIVNFVSLEVVIVTNPLKLFSCESMRVGSDNLPFRNKKGKNNRKFDFAN